MSEPSAGITFKVMSEMTPEYNIPPDLIEDVVAALPPPPDGVSAAWRGLRLTRVTEDIASRVPMNAAQASLAGQIVIVVALANNMAKRAVAPELGDVARCRLARAADALLNTVSRLERTLERRQVRIMPFRDVRPVEKIDMVVLNGVWCRRETAAEDAAAVTSARPVVRDAGPVMPVAAPVRPTVALTRTPLKTSGQQPSAREGVTVEHGDGWSREVWSPGAGAAAMRAAAARDARAAAVAAEAGAGADAAAGVPAGTSEAAIG
jgi:hypothetical protein